MTTYPPKSRMNYAGQRVSLISPFPLSPTEGGICIVATERISLSLKGRPVSLLGLAFDSCSFQLLEPGTVIVLLNPFCGGFADCLSHFHHVLLRSLPGADGYHHSA
jgi:hypothetical protein